MMYKKKQKQDITKRRYFKTAKQRVIEKRKLRNLFNELTHTLKSMERFVGNDIEFVYYGNHEAYSIESLDLCEVIFSTDSNDYEEADEHEEMEI